MKNKVEGNNVGIGSGGVGESGAGCACTGFCAKQKNDQRA